MFSFIRSQFVFLFLLATTLSFQIQAAEFLEPGLETWSHSREPRNSITTETKEVIVFFKPSAYRDHTGLLDREEAISVEQATEENEINNLVNQLVPSLQQGVASLHQILWASHAAVLSLDRWALLKLSLHSSVEGIILNRVVTLDDPILKNVEGEVKADQSSITYGLKEIHADQAWAAGALGDDVVVGVIDTGVDRNHPDLKGKIVGAKDFTDDNDTMDFVGHGTHVCGTIVGGNASGTAIGVAPHAKILMAKVFDHEGRSKISVLLNAMQWMLNPSGDPNITDAPRVVSNSWGGMQFMYGFRNVIRMWRRFGIFPNFAAGNSGKFYFTIGAPGSYPFSFAVGAVDEDQNITSFSSRGPTIWWKKYFPTFVRKPDISAPGWHVFSSLPNGAYGEYSGTSMATPHVAGVIALALSINPTLTVEELTDIISASGLHRGKPGKNNSYGYGIIQADLVVQSVKEKTPGWKPHRHPTSQLTTRPVSSTQPILVPTNPDVPTTQPHPIVVVPLAKTKAVSHSFFQDRDPKLWEWDTP